MNEIVKYRSVMCCAVKIFRGNIEFNNHIKSEINKEFIKNYSKYYKEIDQHT